MIELKAPEEMKIKTAHWTMFLAGSIEMGTATKWQNVVADRLKGYDDSLVLFNPRRDDWDASWEQSIHNEKFAEQVRWEISKLTAADMVLFCFDPDTKSPITLMELGIIAGMELGDSAREVYVVCPTGFWRKGNVDIICEKCGIRVFESLDEALDQTENYLVSNGGFMPS